MLLNTPSAPVAARTTSLSASANRIPILTLHKKAWALVLPLLVAVLLSATHSAPVAAQAVNVTQEPAKVKRSKSNTAPKAHKAPKYRKSSSEESTSERERRLKRECRDLPNSGACLGFGK